MPNIRPVSDLQKYSELLKLVSDGEPLFLTKNGHGRYVVMDIAEYERIQAALKMLGALRNGEESVGTAGWVSISELEEALGLGAPEGEKGL